MRRRLSLVPLVLPEENVFDARGVAHDFCADGHGVPHARLGTAPPDDGHNGGHAGPEHEQEGEPGGEHEESSQHAENLHHDDGYDEEDEDEDDVGTVVERLHGAVKQRLDGGRHGGDRGLGGGEEVALDYLDCGVWVEEELVNQLDGAIGEDA